MSTIGGPGGIRGPGGPAAVGDVATTEAVSPTDSPVATAPSAQVTSTAPIVEDEQIAALARQLAAGQITTEQAVDELLRQSLAAGLSATERAELQETLSDLAATDPNLSRLLRSL
jgi:hypothetical protein